MQRKKIKLDLLIHDLKVPLAVIEAGAGSLLRRPEKYGPLTEPQKKVLMRVLRNTKITELLVNDALELGRSSEGIITKRKFKLSNLIEQALMEILDLKDHAISEKIKNCHDFQRLKKSLEEKGLFLFIDENLWQEEVCMDETKVKQILRNLLGNALKYRMSKVELTIDKDDGCLVFTVKDDGEGIPAVHHKKIFECYFQANPSETHTVRGHGLGLAGVMVLVEEMGGMLCLESDENKGAKFMVHVPLSLT